MAGQAETKLASGPSLVVMAAGIGRRYGGIKQIDPVGPSGEVILEYSIYNAIKAGFGKIVFIIRKDIEEAFRERIGREVEKRAETHYVFQELEMIPAEFAVPEERQKPWGTGHAVLVCRDRIAEPFAVINADDYYGPASFTTLFDWLKHGGQRGEGDSYFVVGYILKNTLSDYGSVSRGICEVTPEGYLAVIRERLKVQKSGDRVIYLEDDVTWVEVSPETPVSMNMWGFNLSFFDELEQRFHRFLEEKRTDTKAEFLVPNIVNEIVQEKKIRVMVLPTSDRWFGITYKEDKPRVEKAVRDLVARGIYPEKLWT